MRWNERSWISWITWGWVFSINLLKIILNFDRSGLKPSDKVLVKSLWLRSPMFSSRSALSLVSSMRVFLHCLRRWWRVLDLRFFLLQKCVQRAAWLFCWLLFLGPFLGLKHPIIYSDVFHVQRSIINDVLFLKGLRLTLLTLFDLIHDCIWFHVQIIPDRVFN